TAPEFTEIPMNQSNECEEQPYSYSADDSCSEVTYDESRQVVSDDECGNYEHLVTLTATDACGNTTSVSFTIVVDDMTAPVIEDSEAVVDGSILPVCADDIWGSVDIPEAIELTTSDNCGGDVTVDFTETYVGEYAPSEGIESYWLPMDPDTMDDGLTCDNFTPHAARLIQFGMWGGDEFYVIDGDEALITNYEDGTRHLYMRVVSQDNADRGWTFEIDLNEGLDWIEWTEQPGAQSYKLDCDGLGDHETWMYHILQSSSQAFGWGAYDGDVLDLTHQPSNGYYGFQMGGGANNKNANNGFSGWFYYEGMFQGQFVMGTGDVFGDMDTSLPWSIEREYTATDCSGNVTSFGYTIDVNGETCTPVLPPLGGANDDDYTWGGNDADDDTTIGEEDETGKNDLIKILGLNPNPADDRSRLTFMTFEDMVVDVAVYNLTGVRVQGVYEGTVFEDDIQNFIIYTNDLENGMYTVRILSTEGDVVTSKLMVAH
ncbi:MAG: T9SS type A sorting domain-containing protein, partial [Flavobacteriales bacterium]